MEDGTITRNIFGLSRKEADAISLHASKGEYSISSVEEAKIIGKKGGKKLDEFKARKENNDVLLVKKIDGPFDENGKKVDLIEKDQWYTYKIIEFSRKPTEKELKRLKWARQYDDDKVEESGSIAGHQEVKLKILKGVEVSNVRIYAYFRSHTKDVSAFCFVRSRYPKLYISTTKTGYTIQKLYGHPAAKGFSYTYEPGVIVETYKAFLRFYENGKMTDVVEFNVTRDGWYYLGEKDKKAHLLNRAFEPKDASKNLYLTEEIHFPSKAPAECKGYFLMQNKNRSIDAEPFEIEVDVNGKPVGDKRAVSDKANNVMLHIGGVYGAGWKGGTVDWLGGSLGCFAFIPQNDIYSSTELAKKASINDDYDDDLSNSHWLKITNKINELRAKDTEKRFFIIINKRGSWEKTKQVELDEILKE